MESTVEKSRFRNKTNGWHWACLLIAGMLVNPAFSLPQTSVRDRTEQPEKVMDAAGVQAGMVIGEVGAGQQRYFMQAFYGVLAASIMAIPVLGIPKADDFSGPTLGPVGIEMSANPGKGEDLIRYLGHCGFAIRTQSHLLIFDYQEKREGPQPKTRPVTPALSNGWIHPQEIKGLKVRVFVSHAHEDHFDPVIFEWQKVIPDIEYFFGWNAADDPPFHYLIGPRAEVRSGGLEISTINSHHSGVPEVAYLVKVDGLVIYHNGDCQPNDPAAYSFLRTKADRIDMAFVMPVYGDNERYTRQNLDIFEKFRPRAVFPMHAEAGASRFFEFEKVYKAKIPGLDVIIPAKLGDRFVFRNGKIER